MGRQSGRGVKNVRARKRSGLVEISATVISELHNICFHNMASIK